MAQDVQIANVQYSDVPALEVPKVGGGTARFTDLSGDTLDANKVLQGYTGHDATGAPFTGTYIPPSGAISVVDTSDSHGGTVRTITAVDISDTTAVASDVASGKCFYTADGTKTAGTASGGGGGLEYEEGTFSPSEDTAGISISFTNTHSSSPFFIHIIDTGDITSASTNSLWYQYVVNWVGLMGASLNSKYGELRLGYKTSSGTNASTANLSNQATLEYYVSASQFKAGNGAYYVRTGRTYKWIAVWAPTT